MPVSELEFVEAYRAANSPQAHAIRFALEDAGVRVLIENESLQDGIGEIPSGWSAAPRIMVEESQLAAAREIISHTDHGRNSEHGPTLVKAIVQGSASTGMFWMSNTTAKTDAATHCLACDAIMTEMETTCPKCGWSYEPDDSAEPL